MVLTQTLPLPTLPNVWMVVRRLRGAAGNIVGRLGRGAAGIGAALGRAAGRIAGRSAGT